VHFLAILDFGLGFDLASEMARTAKRAYLAWQINDATGRSGNMRGEQ
jgi:hypothetical protein